MSKMKYGPRFRGSAVSVGYHYSPSLDDRQSAFRLKAILENQPLYKQELRLYKGGQREKNKRAAIRDKNHRYEAEQRMEEAVRKCVEILEFHMNDLMEHTYTSARPKLVDQNNIHNVIVQLRKKCGVTFENDLQYDRHITVDHGGGCETIEMERERRAAEMKQQKLYRQRNIKEIAKQFAKFRADHEVRK